VQLKLKTIEKKFGLISQIASPPGPLSIGEWRGGRREYFAPLAIVEKRGLSGH